MYNLRYLDEVFPYPEDLEVSILGPDLTDSDQTGMQDRFMFAFVVCNHFFHYWYILMFIISLLQNLALACKKITLALAYKKKLPPPSEAAQFPTQPSSFLLD